MRLTPDQVATIIQTTRNIAGQQALVWLYGSRLNDDRQGGDIDLLVESDPAIGLIARARIKNRLEQALQLPVDVLATRRGAQDSAFVAIARAQSIPLNID